MEKVKDYMESYIRKEGHYPSNENIARDLDISLEDVADALQILDNFYTLSLDAPVSSDPDADNLGSLYGGEDAGFEDIINRESLESALKYLTERQQNILKLRYYDTLPQRQVAGILGISQMHVSRLERQALEKLRKILAAN